VERNTKIMMVKRENLVPIVRYSSSLTVKSDLQFSKKYQEDFRLVPEIITENKGLLLGMLPLCLKLHFRG